jgi:hypothetical protein
MESLEEKVSRLLRGQFGRTAKVELRDEDGIIGTVTSTKFRDRETIDRVKMIWDPLEKSLSAVEQRKIAIIVPMTPEEARGDEA